MKKKELKKESGTNFDLREWLDYKLLQKRIIIWLGDVDVDNIKPLTSHLLYLAEESKKPIKIIMNSPGGEVYPGLLLFDSIKRLTESGIEVVVEVRGLGASMGAVILQAASKRIASRYSRFLIHEVSSVTWGKASEQEEEVRELRKINDMLAMIIAERTGKTVEEINKIWTKKDVWMSAQEAKDFGLVDEVI